VGDSHIRRTGVLILSFRILKGNFDISQGVQPQKVHSGSFRGTISKGTEPKQYDRVIMTYVVLELVPLKGDKNFKPHP